MPLSIQHRHAVLLADRTGDVGTITIVVIEVLAASPETTPLEIETALRHGAAQSYLIAWREAVNCARLARNAAYARRVRVHAGTEPGRVGSPQ